MGKFDFDEMDSAIQNAESKRQYEQQTEFLNKKIELIQELHDSIGIYIEEVRNLVIAVRAIISDINKASTIKCPSNLKSLLDNYANETCIDVTKKMNAEATKVVSRISAMEKRKALPESLFYVLMISAIFFFAFFVTLCYLNYAFFHLDKLWSLIIGFSILISLAIGIAIYLCNRSDNREYRFPLSNNL